MLDTTRGYLAAKFTIAIAVGHGHSTETLIFTLKDVSIKVITRFIFNIS